MSKNYLCCLIGAAVLCVGQFKNTMAFGEEDGPHVLAEKRIGDAVVRVIKFAEEWSVFVPEFGDRNWRTVLCVELLQSRSEKPRRVWQQCVLGRHGFPEAGSFVLSEADKGRFVMAYSRIYLKNVVACLIELDVRVAPLPAVMQVDPKTGKGNWGNSPSVPFPRIGQPGQLSKQIADFWKAELGIELTHKHQVSPISITKIDGGWRIDAGVFDVLDSVEIKLPDGSIGIGPNPVPVRPFAILLDEECKSAKVEVVK